MSRTLGELIAEAEAAAPQRPRNGKECWFKDYARRVGEDAVIASDLLDRKRMKESRLTYEKIGELPPHSNASARSTCIPPHFRRAPSRAP